MVYLEDKYKDTDSIKASKMMLDKAKVEYVKLKPQIESITLNFNIEK